MEKIQDSWCRPLRYKGKILSGGAARQCRMADAGGVDTALKNVALAAAQQALAMAVVSGQFVQADRVASCDSPLSGCSSVVEMRLHH
jgi:hypothetical protein